MPYPAGIKIHDCHARSAFTRKRQSSGPDIHEVAIPRLDVRKCSRQRFGRFAKVSLAPRPRVVTMPKCPHLGTSSLHLLPWLWEIAADLTRTQSSRQPRVAMAHQQLANARGARQAEHPRLGRGRYAVLPVQVAIADDRNIGHFSNALHAAIRVTAAQIVAQERKL